MQIRWLLFSFALAVGIAQSQDKKPTKEESGTAAGKSTRPQMGTNARPFVIAVQPTEADRIEAQSREQERKNKAKSDDGLVTWTRVLAWIAGLQFLALILHAYIFRSQAKVLRESIGEMRKATLASERAASASQMAAETARQEYISSHRPRMRIKHVWLSEPLEEGKPVMVNVVSVNAGDSGAQIIEFGVVTCIVPKHQHPPNDPFKDVTGLYPMITLPSGKSLDHTPQEAGFLTLSEVASIRIGTASLYCFAYVDYIDSSRPPIPRKTSCCRILAPSGGGAMSIFGGVFRRVDESEHEYAD